MKDYNKKEVTIPFSIEEIGRAIMCSSIRVEVTTITKEYIKEIEAGAKRILRLADELKATIKNGADE